MQLENSFTIDAPLDKAWEALNTPEMIAPCFPGATLTAYEGDSFSGTVKVKLGPISLTYKGKGTYISRDHAEHKVVLNASGRDARGNGTASATITGKLTADGDDRTAITMITDMTITGRPAQFGRDLVSGVADKIISQFAACVARKLAPAGAAVAADAPASGASAGEVPTAPPPAVRVPAAVAPAGSATSLMASAGSAVTSSNGSTAASTGPTRSAAPVISEVEAIDLLDAAGSPVFRRMLPVAGGSALVALVFFLWRRFRGRASAGD